ncbi:MAG: hypothetical protein R6U04_08930 [Bacteroidales bacterium]
MITHKKHISSFPISWSLEKSTVETGEKILVKSIKLLIILISFGIIAYKIQAFLNESGNTTFSNWQIQHTILMSAIFFLMVLNWFIESLKWRILATDIQKISITTSFASVLIGITFGLMTPKRIGEIGGRTVMLKGENLKKGWIAFGIGSLVQTSVNALFGLISLLLILSNFYPGVSANIRTFSILSGLTFLFITLFIFHLPYIAGKIKQIPFSPGKKRLFTYLQNQSGRKIASVYSLGIIKYIVFSIQFFLLIHLFGSEISTLNALSGIGFTYLIITFLPFSTVAELGIRGSVAAFAFGIFTTKTGGFVMASMAIWIINLGFPAVLGSILLYHIKAIKSKNNRLS